MQCMRPLKPTGNREQKKQTWYVFESEEKKLKFENGLRDWYKMVIAIVAVCLSLYCSYKYGTAIVSIYSPVLCGV